MRFWFGLDFLLFAVMRLFLNWCTRITLIPEDVEKLGFDTEQTTLYVLRDRSLADLLILEKEAKRLGLPSPATYLPLGRPHRRSYSYMYRRKHMFSRQRVAQQSGHLDALITHLRENPQEDVQIIPVALYWGRGPEKENSLWKIFFSNNWSAPGSIKKFFIILTQGRQLYLNFSEPISLRTLADEAISEERVARKTKRILRVHFRRQQEAMIGPDLSHRRTLVNNLINSTPIRKAIQQSADEAGESYEKHEKRARRYATEIAADYSHTVVRFLEVLLEWVWNRLYSGLKAYNTDHLADIAKTHTLVYTPCHRSHADYLLLSYLVYKAGYAPPHIAAGVNLNLPIIGTILRRGGAFFLRRSFRDNLLYGAVFNEYLHTILSRGYSIEYFVEGGRSRSGRMLSPRAGMLAMTVQSYLRDRSRPIAFVPVYVGYEKLIEGSTYIGELTGQQKQKESVFGFFRSLSILRSHFGEVHVSFGDPILLEEYLAEQLPHWESNEAPDSDQLRTAIGNLGQNIVTRINAAAVANPVNLLALALLGTPKHAMDEEQLRRQLQLYMTLLEQAPYSPWVSLSNTSPSNTIDYGIANDFITRKEHQLGNIISTDSYTALQMAYIRNNSLHLFVLPGLVCSLLVDAHHISRKQLQELVQLLYPFFQGEYHLPWATEEALSAQVDQILSTLCAQGLIEQQDNCYSGAPHNTMANDMLNHLAQTVSQALERFYLTVRILVQHGNQQLTLKSLEDLAHLTAERLSLLFEFNSPEFFDRTVLRSFIQQLVTYGLVTVAEDESLSFDERLLTLDNEAHRILSPSLRQAIAQLTRRDVTGPLEQPTPES